MSSPPGESPPPAPEVLLTLWDRAREIVLVLSEDGAILEANPQAVEAYGRSLATLRTMRVHQLRAAPTIESVPGQMRRAFETGIAFQTEHMRADGTPFPVEVTSSRATLGGTPVLFSVIRDITQRRKLQAELAEADRLAVVGMLAAGVGHEVNNPLTYASASLELALRHLRKRDDADRVVELLTTTTDGLNRVRAIIRDLMSLAHREIRDVAPLDVTSVLDACINLASYELHARARVVRDYAAVPPVLADEGRLGQVFLNLIVNAAQAMPEGRAAEHGVVRISVAAVEGTIEVRIADNGAGIAPELTERVFEPFISTKAQHGKGLGLGLYLSRSLVEAMHGSVSVDSTVGVGSTFVVSLPAATLTPRVPAIVEPEPSTARARVLVIDDEPMIGRVLASALRPEHDVVVVEDAGAALMEMSRATFDAVLCDIGLPGRSGLELLSDVEAAHPRLATRFILMTGGATGALSDEIKRRHAPCLRKPFTIDAVLDAIRTIIAAAS